MTVISTILPHIGGPRQSQRIPISRVVSSVSSLRSPCVDNRNGKQAKFQERDIELNSLQT